MANKVTFGYTILYVADVEKTILFYEQAFGFNRKFISPDKDYGELDTGSTSLAFASLSLAQSNIPDGIIESTPKSKAFGIEIAFVTNDVDELSQKAQKLGATLVCPPKQKPWGQTVAYIRDLNGFLIEICTPIS